MVLLNGVPVLGTLKYVTGYCIKCGADLTLEGTVQCPPEFGHEFGIVKYGFCNTCGRNNLSCEC